MTRIPVVTSSRRGGELQYLRLWLEDPQGEPRIELRRITDKRDVFDQMQRARSIASFFLSRAYVQPLAATTLERGTLVVEAELESAYENISFGLAFLAGCLSLGLRIEARPGRVFTAGLGDLDDSSGCPGGAIRLESVGGLDDKLAAACQENQAVLFLYTDDERGLIQHEEAYWRGEATRSCLPKVLPRTISVASVAAMALETSALLERCTTEDTAAFVLLMLRASGDLFGGLSFPDGVGKSMARLGQKGILSRISRLSDLMQDMGLQPAADGELLIAWLIDRALQANPDEALSSELVQAAIVSATAALESQQAGQQAVFPQPETRWRPRLMAGSRR